MSLTFATITARMRLNLFARLQHPEPEPQPSHVPDATAAKLPNGKTFPADEVVWGIVIRNGFDEMDDPWYHRGTTQHAYLEGNDNVSICGFRPPQSGPRTRRRARLGLPTSGQHPMCGSCARMVVAHQDMGDATAVVAQDPEHPEYGTIQLKFTANPVELRQWIVTDGQGAKTTVILGQLQKVADMPTTLFNIPYEEGQRATRP